MPRFAAGAAVVLVALVATSRASADLKPNGQPIDTSSYTIDLYEGPVFAGSRVVGLAGAYVPVGEGVAGIVYNPAAAAFRVPWSVDWFDWDIDGGFTLPSSLNGFDISNHGDSTFADSAALFLTGSGGLTFGDLGVGVTVSLKGYHVKGISGGRAGQDLRVGVVESTLAVGYAFFQGQLVSGLGVSLHQVDLSESTTQIAKVVTPAFHAGILWAPTPLPIRVGGSLRVSTPAAQTPDAIPSGPEVTKVGDCFVSGGYCLPRTITLPTEAHVGIAFQLFRRMNYGFINPHDDPQSEVRRLPPGDERRKAAKKADHDRRMERYRAMRREKVLVSVETKITFPAVDAVGLESFLLQRVERSGEHVSVSPRLGIETEAIPGYLVLRGGSYIEPTRFERSSPRAHGTGGVDIRIPIVWSVFGLLEDDNTFRVGGSIDGSARYFGWGVTAGIWH